MPLTASEQRELDELELKELEAKVRGSGPLDRGGGVMSAKAPTGLMIDLTLEAGIPAVGQAIASPTTPAGQAAVGSTLSALGNLLAQGRRLLMDEQEAFSVGQLAQATATGAVPFAGPAANAARVASPAMRAAKDLGMSALKQGAVGLGGEAIKTGIDEHRLPSFGEAFVSTAIPGALGAAGTGASQIASRYATRGRRVAENAEVFGRADITPTPGMLMPEELAGTEQKIARMKPGNLVNEAIDRTKTEMADFLGNVAPTPREGAEIFADIQPLLGKISRTDDELIKLKGAAQEARAKVDQTLAALTEAKIQTRGKVNEEVEKAATEAVNEAFTKNLDSVMENARDLAVARATRGDMGLDPATTRDLFVEHVAKPLEATFKEKSAQMYSMVDNSVKKFDVGPINNKVDELTRTASGKLPTDVQRSVDDVRAMLGNEGLPVSLEDLRRARAQLLSRVRQAGIGDAEQRLVKGIAAEITEQMDAQAAKVYGEKGAEALRAANRYYSETRPLFDNPGVEVLFSKLPADEYVGRMLRGMKASGIKSDEYAGVIKLADKIGESHPELAVQIKQQVTENLRQSVIHEAASLDPVSGAMKVSGSDLVKTLEPMSRVPGTLEAIGFGSPETVVELKRLFTKYPDAPKLTAEQWETLAKSPIFRGKTEVYPVQNVDIPKGYTKPDFQSGTPTTVYGFHGLPPEISGMVQDVENRGAIFYSTHPPSAASYSTARQWEPLAQRVNNPPEGVVIAAKILDLDAEKKIFDFNHIDPKEYPDIVNKLRNDQEFKKAVESYRSDVQKIGEMNWQTQQEHVAKANLRTDKLEISNPLVVDYEGRSWGYIKDAEGNWLLPSVSRRSGRDPARDFQDSLIQQAKEGGHDAVILKNIQDVAFQLPGEKPIGDTIALIRSSGVEKRDEVVRRLRPALEPFLAAAAADTTLTRAAFLRNAGQQKAAQRVYDQARNTLDGVNGDVAALQRKYDDLLADPVAVALNNPRLPASNYNAFAHAFFDPKANAVTNMELGAIVQTLRNGPKPARETLTRLQERYIADKVAAFQTSQKSSALLQEPDAEKISIFFTPANAGDAASEIARARTILDPEQMRQLQAFSDVARQVNRYERLGMEAPKPGSYNLPVVGQRRRGLDAVVDWYRTGQYDKLAEALADPAKFARAQSRAADRWGSVGEGLRLGGAQGAGRVVDERLDRN